MKNITLLIVLVITLSCGAQNPVIPLSDYQSDLIDNCYHKDIDNDLDPYVGTWVFQNSYSSFTITFQKIVKYFNGEYYEDMLVGEYKYVSGGVELVNTLTNTPSDLFYHNISATRLLYRGQKPSCSSCSLGERRFTMAFDDPNPSLKFLTSTIVVRYINDGAGIESMEVKLYKEGPIVMPVGAPTEPTVPYGDYLMIKQ
jgi:hypothetical protein